MAKYTLTFSSDRPTGSLGGACFQRSGTVYVIRKRNVPVQKRTPAQSIVKNRFDHVQKNYKNLSAMEQQTFIDEAPNYPRIDSLGNSYTLLASNLQGSSNLNLLSGQQSEITSIPAASAIPTPASSGWSFNPAGTLFEINFIPANVPAGYSISIFIARTSNTEGLAPSIRNMKLIKTFGPGEDATINIATEWNLLWADRLTFAAPRYAWIQCIFTQLSTGQKGTPLIFASKT